MLPSMLPSKYQNEILEYCKRIAEEIKKAIDADIDARELLYAMMSADTMFKNIILMFSLSAEPILDELLTDKGKEWLKKNIIPLLEYIKYIIEYNRKKILENLES